MIIDNINICSLTFYNKIVVVIFLYLFKCGEKMTQTIFFLRKFGLSQYLAKSYSESGIELLDFFVKYEKFNKHLTDLVKHFCNTSV